MSLTKSVGEENGEIIEYFEILETNAREGEGWSYLIPYKKPMSKKVIEKFRQRLQETVHFSLVGDGLSQEIVDYLLTRNAIEPTYFMKRFNLWKNCILTDSSLSNFVENVIWELVDMAWYKGNITFEHEYVQKFENKPF